MQTPLGSQQLQSQVSQLTQQFDQAEHQMWLSQQVTQKVLSRLNKLRLNKLELAAAKSQDTATSELELRRLLNEAQAFKLAHEFLVKGQ
jgi:DNA-binding TFAR19-related protein (PDSD5 family)